MAAIHLKWVVKKLAPKCSRFARCSRFPENISHELEDGIACGFRMFRRVDSIVYPTETGSETPIVYHIVKNFGSKKLCKMLLLKHGWENFGKSKACLYVLYRTVCIKQLHDMHLKIKSSAVYHKTFTKCELKTHKLVLMLRLLMHKHWWSIASTLE